MVADKELFTSSLLPISPNFFRLSPPILPCPQIATTSSEVEGSEVAVIADSPKFLSDELVWLNPPTVHHHFHWDTMMKLSIAPLEASIRRTFLIYFTLLQTS